MHFLSSIVRNALVGLAAAGVVSCSSSSPQATAVTAKVSEPVTAGSAKRPAHMLASPRLEKAACAPSSTTCSASTTSTTSPRTRDLSGRSPARRWPDAREQTLRTVIDHLITRRATTATCSRRARRSCRRRWRRSTACRRPGLDEIRVPGKRQPARRHPDPRQLPRLHSHPGRSSATLRGKALRELLLCQPVPRAAARTSTSRRSKIRSRRHPHGARPRELPPAEPGVRRLPQDHRSDGPRA
jgi:hypothetical protein